MLLTVLFGAHVAQAAQQSDLPEAPRVEISRSCATFWSTSSEKSLISTGRSLSRANTVVLDSPLLTFHSVAAGSQTVKSKCPIGLRIDAGSRPRSEIIRIHLDGHVGNGLSGIQKRNPAGDAVRRRIAQPEIDRTFLFANSQS